MIYLQPQSSNLVHNQNASIKQRDSSQAEADEEVVDAADATAAAADAAAAAPAMLPETFRHDEVEESWVS